MEQAVRWALARIRERPAHEQLRARTREIADLKSQFQPARGSTPSPAPTTSASFYQL
jgi:hypothetical protein